MLSNDCYPVPHLRRGSRKMYRVLNCVAVQHVSFLLLLAAALCAATTFASFSIYSRVAHSQKMMRLGWLFLTGVCTASGIWATHFVAMLAYKAGAQTAYDPVLTAGSLLVAIVATTLGYFVCSGRSRPEIAIGGGIVGLGIGLMHFTGLGAPNVARTLHGGPRLGIDCLHLRLDL